LRTRDDAVAEIGCLAICEEGPHAGALARRELLDRLVEARAREQAIDPRGHGHKERVEGWHATIRIV